MQVLDKLVVYLRVVHMVDYYNGTEFPNEDEMPNKIGVFHIRGPLETTSSKNSLQDGMCQSSAVQIGEEGLLCILLELWSLFFPLL